MELSNEGAAFISREEGAVEHWYLDATGHWTIGIGHLRVGNELSDVASRRADGTFTAGRRLTDAEMWDLFRTDAVRYVEAVDRLVTVDLSQRQFDMLVDFAFNWGIGDVGGFPATSILRLVNAGDFDAVAVELVDGRGPATEKYPQGRPYDKGLAGVRNRRIREAEAFKTGGPAPMSIRLVTRSEWGARSPTGRTSAPDMTRGVGVHWLGPGSGRRAHGQCAAHMREVQAFHMGPARGWADFAYNAAACSHGYVFEGRGPKSRNAANGGGRRNGVDANAGWASVLYLAGTDGPGLTAAGKDAINDAAAWLGVAGGEWLGHRDFLSTECPGSEIYQWVHAGHPRGSAPAPKPEPTPTPIDKEMLPMEFTYIADGADWMWLGTERIHARATSGATLEALKKGKQIVGLGDVGSEVHETLTNLARNAGFSG